MSFPVIVHIPHSSTRIPECEKQKLSLGATDLRRELLRMTDWYADELFDAGAKASRLIFPVSRLLVDPERFPDDANEPMAAKGMGAVYVRTSDGRALRSSLDAEERQRLLDAYYFPHHEAFTRLVETALVAKGRVLIIDAHSFPSSPLPCDLDQSPGRPEICLGTDHYHTPGQLQETALEAFRSLGWRVELNTPYTGSMVPARLYLKDPRVLSVMVEVNRSRYMNEATGERADAFDEVRRKIRLALEAITASLAALGAV